jgi:hypothetical protein
MVRLENSGSLQSHIRQLRYAVATTTCRTTSDLLQRMLREAEARLQKQDAASERV